MQIGCDRGSVLVTALASAIVIVESLLFENESQLQLEFQITPTSVASVFGAIERFRRRNLLARRTYFGEKSGCPRERAALLIANLVFEAILFREILGKVLYSAPAFFARSLSERALKKVAIDFVSESSSLRPSCSQAI